jgi:predicted  nucleic acid-binding Zn-ribbon protein
MEEAQKQLLILQSAKESVEKESASAKSLVSRLNKEVSKMKSQVESLTGKLDLVTSEKDSLAKTGSELQLVAKERDELKTAKEIVESELESAKIENEGNKSRIENLTTFLRKTKASVAELTTKLQQASQAEQEAKRSLAKEMDAHKLVLGELETLKMSNLTTETAVVKFPTQGSLITGSLEASNTVEDISTLSTGKDLPQVPSEGFHFSPSPVQEHIVLATLDKAPLSLSDSDNKGVIAMAVSDTSRQSTDTNLELVAGIRQDTSDNSIETKVSDSNAVSREENSVTENPSTVNESLSVSVPSDENTIKEKLLKRKRDKKVQALVSTVIEPSGSANETEVQTDAFSTVPPSTFTNKSNISEDLKEDGPKNVEGILESRNQHQLNCVPETERAHEPSLEPPRSVEFTGVEQNDFVTEVNSSQNRASEKSSDSSLNIHPDSKQGLIEGVCSTSAETFISDDISSLSEPSKKRILVDENTEMVSNKLPRLNQSSEDEKESSHMDVLCTDDKDTSLLLP